MAAQAEREGRVLTTSSYGLHLGQASGQRVPVSMTAAPLRGGSDTQGVVVVLRDVSTEREIDQLKSSLVSTVSHELRTPLTMVLGFSELLLTRDNLGPERSHDALRQIHTSALRLSRLIDDLLSVSRIESGKLSLDLAAVDVGSVVEEVAGSLREAEIGVHSDADQARRRVEVDLAPEVPPVLADRDKLVQVVMNLVTNALKYSAPPAPVTVRAAHEGNHVEISVIDQGIGMSEQECAQVFEKFSRVNRVEVRRVTGTGLGLYITKSLVEMQQGQIWVRSEPGRGSVFSLSLPVAPTPANGPNPANDKALAVSARKEL